MLSGSFIISAKKSSTMESQSYHHIMMFPWLAFGHMIPFFELSKKLASKGIKISYVSTPKNLQRLPQIPSNLKPNINFIEVTLPSVDGLPENSEATSDLEKPQIPFLKQAYDKLSEQFKPLLRKYTPDLILVDFAPYWVNDIASERGIPIAFFSVYTVSTLTYLGSPTDLKPVMQRPSPDHGQKLMSRSNIPDTSGVSSGQRLATVIEDSSFVVVRSCYEFEGEYIRVIQEKYNKPVLPVGVLPPLLLEDKIVEQEVDRSNILKWLDGKNSKSVVFVGFGSEYKMPVEEITELAFSLELCKLPFLWVVRNVTGKDSDLLLPDGFLGRVLDQGIVTFDWVPQLEILAHPAIGGCLFHSGWGTIVESLGFGHPLILLPMVSDQGLNAKLLVEKELGYEVPRNEDGSFSREIVAKSIRRVMVEQEGAALRIKAAGMPRIFRNLELEESYINKFIEHLDNNIGLEQCILGI